MKLLRVILTLAVLGYAAWLAWPLIQPFLEGAPASEAASRSAATAMIDSGGSLPRAALWLGAIILYVVSAFLLGGGNPRAFLAYLFGFAADVVVRVLMDGNKGGGDSMMRSTVASSGPDPAWVILGALLVIGLLIWAVTRRSESSGGAHV